MIDTSNLNGMSLAITDTNVIVYSVDIDAGDRHEKAHQLIDKLAAANRLVLTAQVLNETYSVLTRPRRAFRLSPLDAANFVRAYSC